MRALSFSFICFLVLGCTSKRKQPSEVLEGVGAPSGNGKFELESNVNQPAESDFSREIDVNCAPVVIETLKNEGIEPTGQTVRCGYVEVPQVYEKPSGKKLKLNFVYLLSAKSPKSPPVIYVQGGPGDSSIDLLRKSLGAYKSMLEHRGVLAIDLRGSSGTAGSFASCNLETISRSKDRLVERHKQCVNYWKGKLDLSSLTVENSALDVLAVMDALGIQKFHYHGVSAAGLLGAYLASFAPQRIASMVLDSPLRPGVTPHWPPYAFIDENVKRLSDVCKKFFDCKLMFPNIYGDYIAAVEKLKKKPLMLSLPDGQSFEFGEENFKEVIDSFFYNVKNTSHIASVITMVNRGNLKRLATMISSLKNVANSNNIQVGYWSIICNEWLRNRQLNLTLPIESEVLCPIWTSGIPEPSKRKITLKDKIENIPTFVLSGTVDPITPYKYGEVMASIFTDSKHLLFKEHGHCVFCNSICARTKVFDFINSVENSTEKECPVEVPFKYNSGVFHREDIHLAKIKTIENNWKLVNNFIAKSKQSGIVGYLQQTSFGNNAATIFFDDVYNRGNKLLKVPNVRPIEFSSKNFELVESTILTQSKIKHFKKVYTYQNSKGNWIVFTFFNTKTFSDADLRVVNSFISKVLKSPQTASLFN